MITIPDNTPAHELVILKARVDELLKAASRDLIRPGKVAKFIGRNGETVYIRIQKMNQKTVSGQSCDANGVIYDPKSGKWRVSYDLLTPVVAAPKIADTLPAPTIAADKPVARSLVGVSDSW